MFCFLFNRSEKIKESVGVGDGAPLLKIPLRSFARKSIIGTDGLGPRLKNTQRDFNPLGGVFSISPPLLLLLLLLLHFLLFR